MLRRSGVLWQEKIQRLSLSELRALAGDPGAGFAMDHMEAARKTHHEMRLRLAHRLRDFLLLPHKAMSNPSMQLVFRKYVAAFESHEQFKHFTSEEAAQEYWTVLAQIFEGGKNVTRLLGLGRRELVHLDPVLAQSLDVFLDRFFTSRLGTHLVGSSFLQRGVPKGARKPAGVAMGVLQQTSPERYLRDLADNLVTSSIGAIVPIEMEETIGPEVLYVPNHLRLILREVLSNAMKATALRASTLSHDPPPVRVQVNRGQFGIFVTVSDQGGGIPCMERTWSWGNDLITSVTSVDEGQFLSSIEEGGVVDWAKSDGPEPRQTQLPLGFGLPLVRLTARYFGGDIKLQTLVGYGTSAYIHIPKLEREEALGIDDSGASFA